MSQWFTATCWFRVNALRVQMQNHTIYLPYHWKGEGQAMLLGPTYNAPGSTKGVSIHALTACLPLHLVWGPACPPAISSYLPLLSSPSQQTKFFFFSYSLWYNMNFPCLVYVPRDKWWGKHFWNSFICQWQMQRFIWNTNKMEILTDLQFRWKVLPRWKVSLSLWINCMHVTSITK